MKVLSRQIQAQLDDLAGELANQAGNLRDAIDTINSAFYAEQRELEYARTNYNDAVGEITGTLLQLALQAESAGDAHTAGVLVEAAAAIEEVEEATLEIADVDYPDYFDSSQWTNPVKALLNENEDEDEDEEALT